jgi:CHAT domain-containing protein
VSYTPLPVRRRKDVTALLTSGRAQVLHFASHGVLRSDDGGIASIVLEDGVLKAEEIVGDEIAIGLRAATPLVFMNACHTGRQMISLTRPDGWVERCLDLGCRGFLGANWEVNDELAARFAIEVYGRLVAGQTIAHAVREARGELRKLDNSNPTWLAYTLYAHPNMKLRPAN